MSLNCVADAWHVVELLSPVDFEAGPIVRQNIPPEPGAHAGECVGERGDEGRHGWAVLADVPAVRDVHKGSELHHRFAVRPTEQRKARLDRGDERVVAQDGHLAVAAHRIPAAERHLLKGKQRRVRELQIHAAEELHAEQLFTELLDPLHLAQPGEELAVRRVGVRIDGRAQHVHPHTKSRADGQYRIERAVGPVLREAERGHRCRPVLKTGERIERHLVGGAVEEKALGEEMLPDDRERHLIGPGLINRVAEAHANDLRVGLDVQRSEGSLDESETIAPVVRRKGCPVLVEGEGVGGVQDRIGAARLAVAELERVSMARQVVVGQGADPTDFSDQRRLVIVDLHRGVKRIPVCHAHMQHAVAPLVAWP